MNFHKQIKNLFNDKQVRENAIIKYTETSNSMIDEINSANPDVVLDLGCGNNIYKGKIKNLVGVDILDNNLQDVYAPIEDLPFDDNYADFVLALGSINFGDDTLIDKQLSELKRVSKPNAKVFFRVLAEHNMEPYYPWTLDKILEKTKKHNFYCVDMPKYIHRTTRSYKEHDDRTGNRSMQRLFCVWRVNK